MMLDFELDKSTNLRTRETELAFADEKALRYDLLLGDILMKTAECELSAQWGWIPIVDFAVCIGQIATELSENEDVESVFDFTDSDATIVFKRGKDSRPLGPLNLRVNWLPKLNHPACLVKWSSCARS